LGGKRSFAAGLGHVPVLRLLSVFRGQNAIELAEFALGILLAVVIRSAKAIDTKPLFGSRIPLNLVILHSVAQIGIPPSRFALGTSASGGI
jgi:hypothetical protein